MGSLRDYDTLARAYEDMKWALKHGVNRIAGEAARTSLLVAAERCGYVGTEPLLVWVERRVTNYRGLVCGSFRELDEKLSALPKGDLMALFPARDQAGAS